MSIGLRSFIFKAAALLSAAGVLTALTGCGVGKLAARSDTPAFKITGKVHGGAYPIQNANVRLLETNSDGTWDPSVNSYVGQARQILITTSDAKGSFSFPDTGWSCTAGQYVYIQVDGGRTTATPNANVIQLAVIGSCSDELATRAEIDNVNLFVSELSTVATAYALSGFIDVDKDVNGNTIASITTDDGNNNSNPGCTGSDLTMDCEHAGLAHGFANANNLVDSVRYDGSFPTGEARTAIPNNAQSTVPQAMINTLGNILQACVDSGGGAVANYTTYVAGGTNSTRCGDLFFYATPPGSTTPPTTTLQAMLNIVANPTNKVDELFLLQPRIVFFSPTLSSDKLGGKSSRLMAYSVSIFYTGTGLPNDAGTPYPVDLALDSNDNAFVVYSGGASGSTYAAVNELASNGTGVHAGARLAAIPNPGSIALDTFSNVWLSNDASAGGNVYQINTSSTGVPLGSITNTLTVPDGFAAGVALDMSNNVWTIRDAPTGQSIYRFNAGNNYRSTRFTAAPALGASCKRLFVDTAQNVLGVSSDTDPLGNSISSANALVWLFNYNYAGKAATFSSATLTAKNGFGLAMDIDDNPFLPLAQELDTETGSASTGVIHVNGNSKYTSASSTGTTYHNPMGVAIDGAGNLFWSDFAAGGQVFKFVMSAAPSVAQGTLTSFLPCYPLNGVCDSASVANLRSMAIDSSGAMWYLSDGATGQVVQTLGVAAPSFPLLSYAHGGVTP